jgi:3-oxoacyl-[acyl-carrier protein] reductase
MRLQGKIAIVTGAGGGFGEGIAKRFAKEGAKISVVDIRSDAAERVAGEIGQAAIALTADVGAAADVQRVVDETTKRLGTPSILVNNAGTTHKNRPLLEVDEETFDLIFRVNVKSIFHFVRTTAPVMRDAGGGVILNVGSTAGLRPRPGLTWYNATKGASSKPVSPITGQIAFTRIFQGASSTARDFDTRLTALYHEFSAPGFFRASKVSSSHVRLVSS